MRLTTTQPREIDDLDNWLERTRDPDPKVRKWAAHYLCPCEVKANYDDVWDRLLAMVTDPDARVRGQVLHALADGSPRSREPEVVRAVEGMWNDPDESLRRRVRKLLAQYRRTGKINVL